MSQKIKKKPKASENKQPQQAVKGVSAKFSQPYGDSKLKRFWRWYRGLKLGVSGNIIVLLVIIGLIAFVIEKL